MGELGGPGLPGPPHGGRATPQGEPGPYFHSVPPIEESVNDEFGRRFPTQATEQQAAFAPMRVHGLNTDELSRNITVWLYTTNFVWERVKG